MDKTQTVEEYLKSGGKIKQCPSDTYTKKEGMHLSNLIVRHTDTLYYGAKTRHKKLIFKKGSSLRFGKRVYTADQYSKESLLTKKWIREKLLKGICERTGIKFDYSSPKNGQATNPLSPSIDRIDGYRPYSESNCQMVVWAYNRAKGEGTDEELLLLAEQLIEYTNKSCEKPK